METTNNSYAAPVKEWIQELQKKSPKKPLIIGINAPQGAGKTTLCNQLVSEFSSENLRTVCISIDDFYLTNKDQRDLSSKYPNNPLLEHRGYPGTHDIALGTKILTNLKSGAELVPRYDKSAFSGRGDRFPEDQWTKVDQIPDIILFEGWMLGYEKQPELTGNLQDSNDLLPAYQSWTELIDHQLLIFCKNKSVVKTWRLQAEQKARLEGKPTLTDDEVSDYISRFIEAYNVYQEPLIEKLSNTPDSLVLEIAEDRSLVRKLS